MSSIYIYINVFIQALLLMNVLIEGISSLAFSSNGKYLATGSWDNNINIIDLKSKTIYHKFDNIHSSNHH